MTEERERERYLPYRSEVEHFVESPVWRYIVEEMMIVAQVATEENDDVDPYKEPAKIVRNQEKIRFAKMVIDLPRSIAEESDEMRVTKQIQEEEEEHDSAE